MGDTHTEGLVFLHSFKFVVAPLEVFYEQNYKGQL